MYSTKCSSDLRYIVACITSRDQINLVDTIVDMGARRTCYQARLIDSALTEDQFKDKPYKLIGGFVGGKEIKNSVRFYQFQLQQFTIGNIDMGSQVIWITFDDRIQDNVLGMDILRSVCMLQYANEDELFFFKDREEIRQFVINSRNL